MGGRPHNTAGNKAGCHRNMFTDVSIAGSKQQPAAGTTVLSTLQLPILYNRIAVQRKVFTEYNFIRQGGRGSGQQEISFSSQIDLTGGGAAAAASS